MKGALDLDGFVHVLPFRPQLELARRVTGVFARFEVSHHDEFYLDTPDGRRWELRHSRLL
jgi:hypothetical protein